MQVFQATIADTADVLALVRAKAEFDRQLGAFTGALGTTEELIRRHLFGQRPVAFALLAGEPGRAIGFALYYYRYSSFRGRPSIWLDDLFVYPPDRRNGAGRLLMCRLAELAVAAEGLAKFTDYPVTEIDLHSRHAWLLSRAEGLGVRLREDPCYFDVQVAGWWAWGQALWIGAGWCDPMQGNPETAPARLHRKKPGMRPLGVHSRKIPCMNRQGVHRDRILHTYGTRGLHSQDELVAYFHGLQERLRRVRVLCGDWSRVLTPGVLSRDRMTAVFLDPPYKDCRKTYADHDQDVADEVYRWAVSHGHDIRTSIAYCCFAEQYPVPEGWTVYTWNSHGYAKTRPEWVMFSPFCFPRQNRTNYVEVVQ